MKNTHIIAAVDYDDGEDLDLDGIPDGEPVDNCISAPNGNCDADLLNCDVNCNRQITARELAVGDQAFGLLMFLAAAGLACFRKIR